MLTLIIIGIIIAVLMKFIPEGLTPNRLLLKMDACTCKNCVCDQTKCLCCEKTCSELCFCKKSIIK